MTLRWQNVAAPQLRVKTRGIGKLRKLLDELVCPIHQCDPNQTWEKLNRHRPRHQVKKISDDSVDSACKELVNCFAYALGIATDPRFLAMARRSDSPVVCDKTFEYLQDILMKARPIGSCEVGDIASYQDPHGELVHVAVVIEPRGLVQSKWGGGDLFEHGLLELPSCLGEFTGTYLTAPDPDEVIKLLSELRA